MAMPTPSVRIIGRGTQLGYGSKYRDSDRCWGFAIGGLLFRREGNPSATSWMISRSLSAILLEDTVPDMQIMGQRDTSMKALVVAVGSSGRA